MFPLLISLLSLRTDDFEVISDSKLNDVWRPDYTQGTPCHPVPSFLEPSGIDSRNFTLANSGDLGVTVLVTAVSSNFEVFHPHIQQPRLDIGPGESKGIEVFYNCRDSDQSDVKGWAELYLTVKSDDHDWTITYTKVCDASKLPRGDLSLLVLLCMAVGVVWVGAVIATSSRVRTIVDDETNDLQMSHVCGFLVLGSFFLVLMFFFLVYLEVGLLIMISFSSFSAIFFTLTLLVPSSSRTVTLPGLGAVPISQVGLAAGALGLVLWYLFTRNWILNNLIGVSLVLMFLKVIKLTSFKVGAAFLSFAFLYDVFWVFYSHLLFGESVMIYVATHVDLPMKLECPYFSLFPVPHYCSLIGLGDLVLPGLVIVFARRIDSIEGSPYFKVSLAAYTLALLACGAVLVIFKSGQPALMYISPALICSLLFMAWRRKEMHKLWSGLEAYVQADSQPLEERLELVERPIN
jgi:hypothetical protein